MKRGKEKEFLWKKEKERGIFNGEIIKIYYLWKCG